MVRQSLPQLPSLRQHLSALQWAKTPVQFSILTSINMRKTRNGRGVNSGREMRNKRLQARPAEALFGAVKSSPTVSPVNATYGHNFWVFSVAARLIARVGCR